MTASLTTAFAPDPARPARLSHGALAGVALAHAGLFALLLAVTDAPAPTLPPRLLTVSLMEPVPEPVEPVEPVAAPAPPRPQSVLEARRATPASQEAAVAPPVPETPASQAPLAQPAPQPMPAHAPVPASVMAEVAPSAPPRPADYLANPKPPYPALSRRLGEEGQVRLNVPIQFTLRS